MRDDWFYVVHILDCIANVEEDTAAGREAFLSNRTLRDAVMRNLQILAESSQRISDSFKEQFSEVPWRLVGRFRNVAVHDYLDVRWAEIWDIVAIDLPPLKSQLTRILSNRPHS